MTKLCLFFFMTFLVLCSKAQDPTVTDLKKDASRSIAKDPNDTIPKTWKLGGLFNLNINQGSLSNWSGGGENFSFSLNSYLFVYAFYKKNKNSWDNSLDLGYGVVRTTSLGSRKASDKIDLLSKYGYALSPKWNAGALFNLRSQFAKGFTYSKTATGQDSSTLISNTFAPAYLMLSLGFDYKPITDLSVFISPLTGRWVIVNDDLIAPLYGLDPGKNVKDEFGAFLSVNYILKLKEKFVYKTKLDLFSNYKHNPQNIDIFWTNAFSAKITKYINFTFNFDLIYDDDTKNVDPVKGPAPQLQQLMGIGFAYKFSKK